MALNIKKLLVSHPKPTSEKSPYFDIAEKYGVEIDFRPFIKVEPLTSKEFRQQKITILDHTAVIFTARTAIDHFFNLCEELRVTIPETMKYFCMTEAIAVYLQKYIVYRKRKIFFGQTGKLEDLVTVIGKHAKEKYLVAVSDVHKEDLFTLLTAKKINYTKAVMYRTVSNDFSKEEKFDYDVQYVDNITFLGDWKIIFKTLAVVLKRDGINSSTSVTMEEFMGSEKQSETEMVYHE